MNREMENNFAFTLYSYTDFTVQTFATDQCCRMESQVEVSLADIHQIATHLGISMTTVYDKFCAPALEKSSGAPIGVFLIEQPPFASCPFRAGTTCTLGSAKPFSCRIRPAVRKIEEFEPGMWRVIYSMPHGTYKAGPVTCKISDLLLKVGADGAEKAYGQLQLGLIEVGRHCEYISNAIGQTLDPRISLAALRDMYITWDDEKSLDENAEHNRTIYRQTLWSITEPIIKTLQ